MAPQRMLAGVRGGGGQGGRVSAGMRLEGTRLASPFLLRLVEPPLGARYGRRVTGLADAGSTAKNLPSPDE